MVQERQQFPCDAFILSHCCCGRIHDIPECESFGFPFSLAFTHCTNRFISYFFSHFPNKVTNQTSPLHKGPFRSYRAIAHVAAAVCSFSNSTLQTRRVHDEIFASMNLCCRVHRLHWLTVAALIEWHSMLKYRYCFTSENTVSGQPLLNYKGRLYPVDASPQVITKTDTRTHAQTQDEFYKWSLAVLHWASRFCPI